ncbi:MAG TPA: hypothetical protein PK970_05050 [Hyphomicrobiaceae bacterium]|nr:hypothetical protein [Hyphomicrobiaceae bacterium]
MLNLIDIVRPATAALGISLTLGGTAAAQEFCVVCTAPATMYRCTIDNYRPGAAPNLGAVCTDAMTRTGAHATCTIGKGITVLDCNGPLMRVDIANPTSPVVTNAAAAAAKAAKERSQTGDPKTVLDMIKRAQTPAAPPATPATPATAPAAKPSAPAGAAVKGSDQTATETTAPAKKPNPLADTWRCMSSFFTRCGD